MEQNNHVENQVNELYENIKIEVVEAVKADLTAQGNTVIPAGYSPEKEAVAIVQKYNELKDKIAKEAEYNQSTYKEDVAKMKNLDLHYDLKDAQEQAIAELESILVKSSKDYADKIARMQNSPEYKEAKNEAFQLLSLLKDAEIPVNKLMEIASPLIETHDLKSLEICQILLAKNATASYAINAAMEEIKSASQNAELTNMIDCLSRHVTSNYDGLDYFNYMYNWSKED